MRSRSFTSARFLRLIGVCLTLAAATIAALPSQTSAAARNCGSFGAAGALGVASISADGTFSLNASVSDIAAASNACGYKILLTSNDGPVYRDSGDPFTWASVPARSNAANVSWTGLSTENGSDVFTVNLVFRRTANNSDAVIASVNVQLPIDGELSPFTVSGEPRYGTALQVSPISVTGYPAPVLTDQFWRVTPLGGGDPFRAPDSVVREADSDYEYCVTWYQEIIGINATDCSENAITTGSAPAYDPSNTPQSGDKPLAALGERSISVVPAWLGETVSETIVWRRQLPNLSAVDSRQRSRTYVITNVDDGAVIWAEMMASNAMGFPTPTIHSVSVTLARPSWSTDAQIQVVPEYDAAGRLVKMTAKASTAAASGSPTPATRIAWERCLRNDFGEVRCGPGEAQAANVPANEYRPRHSTTADQVNEIGANVVFRAVLRAKNVLGEAVVPSMTVGAMQGATFDAPAPIAEGSTAPPPEDLAAVPPPSEEAPVDLPPPLPPDLTPPPEQPPTTNTATVAIQGSPVVGESLVAKVRGMEAETYQWQRCGRECRPISGAQRATYVLTAADVGSTIRVRVTGAPNVEALSAQTSRVRDLVIVVDNEPDVTVDDSAEPANEPPKEVEPEAPKAPSKPQKRPAPDVNEAVVITPQQSTAPTVTELVSTADDVSVASTVHLLQTPVGRGAGGWKQLLCGSTVERGLWKTLLGANAPSTCRR